MRRTSLARRYPRTSTGLLADPFFRQFDQLFRDDTLNPLSLFGRLGGEEMRAGWVPPVDVQETEEAYVFSAELPGLTREDVNITVEDNLLTLSGERKFEEATNGDSYHRIERAYGSFSRSFTLPHTVDSDKISANFKEGLLTISIPKAEQAKPRKVKIS